MRYWLNRGRSVALEGAFHVEGPIIPRRVSHMRGCCKI
jgi:hypothetical protein